MIAKTVTKKRRMSDYDRMYQKTSAYFQPVGELEISLVEIITKESLRARNLGRLTDAAEDTLEHSVTVLRKVQSMRQGASGAKVPEMRVQ